jgi:iron complex outermembrane recepter protein
MNKLPFVAVILPLAINTGVHVQAETSSLHLEEIIVTASRRATSLQDTPIAVTAFSQTLMEELNINNPFAYEALVPSLTYQQSPNRLSIRGVGRFSNSLGTAPGVAIYNDGIFTAEATSLSTQPINIDRTEILRGPQGTLYGRNTTGGAVNIISRRPASEFEADLRVKVGEEDLRQFAGVVSGPVTESLRYKLHYINTERDGLTENTAGEDWNATDSWYAEGQIEWDITEKLHLWAEYARFDYDNVPNVNWNQSEYNCETFWNGLTKNPQYLACENGYVNVGIDDPRKVARNAESSETLNNNNSWTARLSYDFKGAELSYLFGLVEYDYDIITDSDGTQDTTPENQVFLHVGQYQEQRTHEMQLISNWDKDWDYVAGLYYIEDKNEQPYNIYAPDNPTFSQSTDLAGNFWDNPLGVIYFQNGRIDNESWAIFGEVDFSITDKLSMTLGARYSEDDFKGEERQIRYYNLYREYAGEDLPLRPGCQCGTLRG